MIVGLLQFAPQVGRVDDNLASIEKYMAGKRFDLAVLPELATTGYTFATRRQVEDVAERKGGKSFTVFENLAVGSGGAIVWGMAERSGRKIYNSAVMTTPQGDHFVYRKTHLFFREKLFFAPGDTGFRVFPWRGMKIGLMICFDWIFPEAARTLALRGCAILAHPANLVLPYCQDAMITRSLENKVFSITANRVGTESAGRWRHTFTGRSQVVAPSGERLLRFSTAAQGFRTVKIDPRPADNKSVTRLNDLFADRRPDFYGL